MEQHSQQHPGKPARCYIALGSNLQEPRLQLERAIRSLRNLEQCRLQRISSPYRSRAVGPGRQPDYLNAVVCLDAALAPTALLRALQDIEDRQGRVRRERWGSRTLDLDLLLYGDQVVDTPSLQIPHPRLSTRRFVLAPLAEIAPEQMVPGAGCVRQLLATCPAEQLERQPPFQVEEFRYD